MKKNRGAVYLILLLVMSGIFIFLAASIMGLAFANLKLARHNESVVSSVQVAEAGVNYYLWHLSHNNLDYCDGNALGSANCPTTMPTQGYGPFAHDFKGPGGNVVGNFSLYISKPIPGGTITEIKAIGKAQNSTVSRTVVAGIGLPSFANYGLLANADEWFSGTVPEETGPIHTNGGIRFDVLHYGNIVSSSKARYIPQWTYGGSNCNPTCTEEDGIWTTLSGVDKSSWQFPTPLIDFNTVTVDLSKLKTSANSNGVYLDTTHAGSKGYYLKLKADNTIDISKVTNETSTGITSTFVENRAAPTNGILYSEKPIWIDGAWNSKITIATEAKLPSGRSITLINNLTYVNRNDGSNKIGLISTGHIQTAPYSPANLETDAALLSQNGRVSVDDWVSPKRFGTWTIFGSIASFDTMYATWVNGDDSFAGGYLDCVITYDPHLTIDPPPNFPTSGNYNILTWREE